MDLNEIKNLIKLDGGKFIIVENGKPVLIVMSFDDYKRIISNPAKDPSEKTSPLFEEKEESDDIAEKEINKEIDDSNQEFSSEHTREYPGTVEKTSPQTEESLKIEDLPV